MKDISLSRVARNQGTQLLEYEQDIWLKLPVYQVAIMYT